MCACSTYTKVYATSHKDISVRTITFIILYFLYGYSCFLLHARLKAFAFCIYWLFKLRKLLFSGIRCNDARVHGILTCMYVCTHACVYVCMHVCMHNTHIVACMYVRISTPFGNLIKIDIEPFAYCWTCMVKVTVMVMPWPWLLGRHDCPVPWPWPWPWPWLLGRRDCAQPVTWPRHVLFARLLAQPLSPRAVCPSRSAPIFISG